MRARQLWEVKAAMRAGCGGARLDVVAECRRRMCSLGGCVVGIAQGRLEKDGRAPSSSDQGQSAQRVEQTPQVGNSALNICSAPGVCRGAANSPLFPGCCAVLCRAIDGCSSSREAERSWTVPARRIPRRMLRRDATMSTPPAICGSQQHEPAA